MFPSEEVKQNQKFALVQGVSEWLIEQEIRILREKSQGEILGRNKYLQMKNVANDIYDFYIFARIFFKVVIKGK